MANDLVHGIVGAFLVGAMATGALAQNSKLPPRIEFSGPALAFDFPGLRIGVAEYDDGPTGTTLFYFPEKVMGVVDVRGGAPGTVFTDALRLGRRDRWIDGIVFSGGSAYGLAAATGAAAALKPKTVRDGQWRTPPVFPGAIIYDIFGRRLSTVTPDEALGKAALGAAVEGRFLLGPRGAGRSAMQGIYFADDGVSRPGWAHSGQGGAFRQRGPTKIAVFTVVNALGAVVDRQGRLVRCSYAPAHKDCGTIEEALKRRLPQLRAGTVASDVGVDETSLSNNTTVTLVVTNQKLEVRELQRLAVQVHSSMARGIQPYSTMDDGDVLFAVTTQEVENSALPAIDLSTIASEVAWDAILASVPPQDAVLPMTPVQLPLSDLDKLVGTYEFPSGTRITVRRDGDRLRTSLAGMGGLFFSESGNALVPVGAGDFLIEGPRSDRVRFTFVRGRPIEMILNPGQWAQLAKRVR